MQAVNRDYGVTVFYKNVEGPRRLMGCQRVKSSTKRGKSLYGEEERPTLIYSNQSMVTYPLF